MRMNITTSFEKKKRAFFNKKKKILHVLINILKFPPPEDLLTPCKNTLD